MWKSSKVIIFVSSVSSDILIKMLNINNLSGKGQYYIEYRDIDDLKTILFKIQETWFVADRQRTERQYGTGKI